MIKPGCKVKIINLKSKFSGRIGSVVGIYESNLWIIKFFEDSVFTYCFASDLEVIESSKFPYWQKVSMVWKYS